MAKPKKLTAYEMLMGKHINHPVCEVVHPLRVQAMADAIAYAHKFVESVRVKLEEHGGDFNAAYPAPDHNAAWSWQGKQDAVARMMAGWVVKHAPGTSSFYSRRGQHIVILCAERIERYMRQCVQEAADRYDAFVLKLVDKIGPCLEASIEVGDVWHNSRLTVRIANPSSPGDVTVQIWKTKQIVNVSKLGKYFNQYPTRLIYTGNP